MGRSKNDGRGRLGGREKGTPNKITADMKAWIAEILNDGRGRFMDSLNNLEDSEYIRVYTNLLNYVVPKIQAISGESGKDSQTVGGITLVVKDEAERDFLQECFDKLA